MQGTNGRVSWILTYGASGNNITHEQIEEYNESVNKGKLILDECYTTTDKALKYTMIHLEKKRRKQPVSKFMEYMEETHGIVSQEIFGYSAVDNASCQEIHPAHHVIYAHYIKKNAFFQGWTKGEQCKNGGLLNHPGLKVDPKDSNRADHDAKKRPREDDSTLILGEASGAASTSAEERLKTQFAERERALGAAFDEKERGLKDEITAKDNELINQNAEIAAKNNELITKNAEIAAKENQFTAKNIELELLQGNYYALQLNVQEKDARIEELSDVIRRMETDLRRMETNGAAHGGGARRDAQPLADQHIQLQAPIIQPEAPGQWDLIDSPGLLRIQIGLQEGSIKKLKEDLDAANKETQRAYKQVRDEEARWAAERAEITNNPAGTRYYCDEMASIEKAKEHLRMITAMAARDADKMILKLEDEILDKEYNMIIMLSGKGNDSSFRGAVQHQFLDIYNKMTSDNTEAMNTRYHSKFAQDRVGKVQQAAGRGRGKR